ncbi:TCP-1/cpn60 chaperonin family-domain-containing protein [Aspergillus filifer]
MQAAADEFHNLTPLEKELCIGNKAYEKTMKEYGDRILPKEHPHSIMANRVLQRLVPYASVDGADWEVFVVKADAEKLAFCTPGGKLFVFSGIIPVCNDDDGLAFLLAHEMSHIIAGHWREKLGEGFKNHVRSLAPSLVDWSRSKEREVEADKMGLMMMSKACFNPEAAVRFWKRMPGTYGIYVPGSTSKQEVKSGPSHPGNLERIMNLRGLMEEAWKEYDNSECGATEAQAFTPTMSLSLPGPSQAGLFKPGYQSHDAEDGAVIRNIEACQAISQTVQTSLGPYGRNKIVINHLQKMILTSDAATILRELDVVHPAAKLLVMASQQQDAEMGDGTNLVIVLAGELLKKAEELLRLGLKTSDITLGYEKAQNFALKVLEDLEVDRLQDLRSQDELARALRTVVASKQSGTEHTLAALVAEAVLAVLPKNPVNFNVDNVRVVKIMGGSLEQSRVIKGMVFGREPEGSIKKATKAKVGVFSCPIDISQTETKGTVLLKNAQEMLDFTKGEEERLEAAIKELYDSGLRVVVAGAQVGDLALHYLNRFNILVVKILSKFELRRLCRVVGATPLARLGAPMPDEMGSVDVVETTEIGGDRVTVFRQEDATAVTRTSTIVLRGATQNHLDDVERAIDDGVNAVKAITKDPRLVPGAGATEIQLVERISAFADRTPGLPQHAIRKYAEAFEVIPRTLAESAGLDATEVLSRLYTAHQRAGGKKSESAPAAADDEESSSDEDDEEEEEEETESPDKEAYWTTGIDLEGTSSAGTLDAVDEGILDLLASKSWAIRLASESARTVLSVDQIIVARQAGGPKPPGPNPNWDED